MDVKLKKLRQLIKKNKIDALIITNPVNRRYLSGFDGTAGLLLIGPDQAYLVTDFRYYEQAVAQAKHFKVYRWQDDLIKHLARLLDQSGWHKLGFEAKHVIYTFYAEMKNKLPVELVALDDAVEKLRMIKDDHELAELRCGARILDDAFSYICTVIKPGIAELEVARELEIYLLRSGAEEKSFKFIVASGIRGAMPHGTASKKIIDKGDLVTIDFGAVFNGYATDMTRTVAISNISMQGSKIYDIVKEAQQKALDQLKPGITGKKADRFARDVIANAGYGQHFGHGLGHGLGLETHEQPVLNPKSSTVLKAGMVVTVEPGIYIPEFGGVRIEDMVAITKDRFELLTGSTRELIKI